MSQSPSATRTRAKIVARVDRPSAGQGTSETASRLRAGLFELRIDWGPCYRVYYAMTGRICVLLLCGGDKRRQSSDIKRALEYLKRLFGKNKHPMKRKASISHDEVTVRELRDNPDFAAEYLKAAVEDADEPSVLLIALRRIAEARGGIAKVAKAAGIERESLYRALSARGNPRLSTLVAVTKAVGLKLTVEPAP
ncbi:MAG: type II toxin-antitoxin system RelE/ParE family toxin [Candidatus Sulfotelmatobacter sp.]